MVFMKFNVLTTLIIAWMLAVVPVDAAVQGFTNADIVSNHESLSGNVWIIQWTDTGFDSDSLVATLEPDDFYDLTEEEFTTEQDFRVSVDATDDGCFYRIQEATRPKVFTVDADFRTFWVTDRATRDEWISNNCFNGEALVKTAANIVSDYVWCFVITDYRGTPGDIGSPQYEFETIWSVSADGRSTESATICSGARTSEKCSGVDAKIGSYAYVEWQGSLDTGKKCEDPKNEYAMHSNTFTDGWRVVDKPAYDDFYSYWYSLETWKDDIEDWAAGTTTETYIQNKANGLASNAVQSKTTGVFVSQWSDDNPDIENPSFTDGLIRWSPSDDRLLFPTFNLYVDGDYYLQVVKPCGEPEITRVSIDTIEEGSRENAKIYVKNIGDYDGAFTVRVTGCTGGFSVEGGEDGIHLDAGESGSVSIPIGFTSTSTESATETGTCTAEMESTCPDVQSDTYTFSVTGKQIQDCVPGHRKCGTDGEEVIECNDAGLAYEHLEYCASNEVCVNGYCEVEDLLFCGDGICEPGETIDTCPEDCKVPECGDGICQTGEIFTCSVDCGVVECSVNSDCDDSLVCTIDTCLQGQCVHTLVPGCVEGEEGEMDWLVTLGYIAVALAIIAFVAYVYIKRQKRPKPLMQRFQG
jgi:hypothetical protein